MGFWQKVRKWIDGDEAEHHLEDLMANAKPGSPSMQFIVRVVDAIKADLVSGIYIPSTDLSSAYFPPVYYVFLSEVDSKDWIGERLSHFQSRVAEGVMKKIAELDKKKSTQTVRIEVRTDATLNPGQIRVQSLQDFTKTTDRDQNQAEKGFRERSTIKDNSPPRKILYRLELWNSENKLSDHEISSKEIFIGRGENVNIELPNNEKIGRIHASLMFDGGELFVVSMNENPTSVGDEILDYGQKKKIDYSDEILIYEYRLIPKVL